MDTSRLTPLDFRITAAVQFRILKALCSGIADGVDLFQTLSLDYSLISTRTVSRQTLNLQTDAVIAKFNALVQTSSIANSGPQFLTMLTMLARLISAAHTNAFELSIPSSGQYEAINNFYPHHDNASYNNVSCFHVSPYY